MLAVASGGPKILASLTGEGLPLEALDGSVEATDLRDIKVDVVAFAGDETSLRAVRRALAERNGPIVRLVSTVIEPIAYVHERAICVDTTAAGGNASLLAAAE